MCEAPAAPPQAALSSMRDCPGTQEAPLALAEGWAQLPNPSPILGERVQRCGPAPGRSGHAKQKRSPLEAGPRDSQ
ncbi:hypothetical protein NDU88_002760 [Pleurodeles waltl]|uniref:Uncharacterized protein n=1 Tax=Pleurodeles waltl TaxID=8319 RepID=A0AAV7MP05_PLEWA|nr:hypothetical protein NDU88_002760 [Pleurodeles waltl]